MALAFNISMPLHMLFRSSSLIATFVIGRLFFGRQYSRKQMVSVLLISAGIFASTFADISEKTGAASAAAQDCCSPGTPCADDSAAQPSLRASKFGLSPLATYFVGLSMLTASLFGSAVLGQLQQSVYSAAAAPDGTKPYKEGLFYTHVLCLPAFFLMSSNLSSAFSAYVNSPPLALLPALLPSATLPRLLLLLAGNTITQFVCISGVYRLTSVSGTLTCTMALTLRKFFSIIVSVILFGHSFTTLHAVGAVIILAGVLLFQQASQQADAGDEAEAGGDSEEKKKKKEQ
eukprot:PLAT4709.1.p1 GENE.PLAT4709.1~~PLAT4709.1.p1  ORF type:complete len:289 (+),score=137.55 PLAT4709.1:287-1153(+)